MRNNGADWAEGLRLCYDFAPNVLYKVTVAYGASARTDGYALIKGADAPTDKHVYSLFDGKNGKAFAIDGLRYKNGVYDFTVSQSDTGSTATFLCYPEASGMQLILGVSKDGKVNETCMN